MGCLCIEENHPLNKNRTKEEPKEPRLSKMMGGKTNPITDGIKENNNAFTQSNEKNNYKNEIDNPYYNQPENQYPNIDDIEKSYEEYQEYQEEPLYEEIFFDGNSDCYDMILNFESFEQLKKQGWTANFSLEGWKKYQTSINSENIIIGVVGIKNRGKSYLLKRIMKNDNYKQNEGFLVTTYGISCGFPILEENNKYQAFVTLDTAGRDNPLLQNAFYQENDIRSIIKDQKVCEILLSDFIIKESNVLIAVVEQLSFAEQDMLTTLINRLKLKEVNNNIDKRKLIVIHNLQTFEKIYDVFGIMYHTGNLQYGHYYAICYNIKHKKWLLYNDDKVSEIKESDIHMKDAYVLFYRRRGLESMVDLEKIYMKKFKDYTNKIATIKKNAKKEVKHKENN